MVAALVFGVLTGPRMSLSFGVLGPLLVRDETVIELRRPSHRRLLSILLLEAGRRQSTDVLIERFWGEAVPATAKAALQTHVSALRGALPDGVIRTEGYSYVLSLEGHVLDAIEFTRGARQVHELVREGEWDDVARVAGEALELWRGAPFPELADDLFARAEIARLEELRAELLEFQAESMLATGREPEVAPMLERLVAEYPMRERLWEQLMVARFRTGRHADALAAYREVHGVLAEVGLEPGAELRRLEVKILRHDDELQRRRLHNLPVELTTFVGRDRELDDVTQLLATNRMVTVTGVGGAGKTRLALRTVTELLDAHPDGCWMTELASIHDPEFVVREVAATRGLRPQAGDILTALQTEVAAESVLFVLDNCEHLRAACADVARALIEAGPGVKVLATSREPLGVPGEVVYEVPPMSFPQDPPAARAGLRRFDAVRLFEDRAALARPGYAVSDDDAHEVAEICRRLDGLPLAIELAAARVRTLNIATIADRLDDRFRLLTGGSSTAPRRQRTLEATVRWSHDLLHPQERTMLARLSVFRGDFDLEMAESVAAGDGVDAAQVVDLVAGLADKSLISSHETAVGRRYRLLETIREFAAERLELAGEAEDVRAHHRDWCVAFARHTVARIYGPGRRELLARLSVEVENLSSALTWSVDTEGGPAVAPLAGALAWHWSERGHVALAITYLESALEHCDGPSAEAELRSRLARECFMAGDVRRALEEAECAHGLVAAAPPSVTKAIVLFRHARLLLILVDQDPRDAVPIAREAVETAAALGDRALELRTRSALAAAHSWSGEADEGLDQQRSALDLAIALGDRDLILEMYGACYDLLYLHATERREGPARITEEMFAHFPEVGQQWEAYRAVADWLPYVHIQVGDWQQAEESIARLGERHLEGFDRTWRLMLRTTLRWMQGRTADARIAIDELERLGVNPRWYHDYFPLRAEVAADEGRLDEVRRDAARYIEAGVDPSEEAMKLGVLAPLVRAEVDAALAAAEEQREVHGEEAERAVARMGELLAAFPPPAGGSVQLETPATHLAFAEAELSRLGGGDPARWRAAADSADYLHTRLYARWRLAESLIDSGHESEGASELREVHADAVAVGAQRIREELEQLAARADVELAVRV